MAYAKRVSSQIIACWAKTQQQCVVLHRSTLHTPVCTRLRWRVGCPLNLEKANRAGGAPLVNGEGAEVPLGAMGRPGRQLPRAKRASSPHPQIPGTPPCPCRLLATSSPPGGGGEVGGWTRGNLRSKKSPRTQDPGQIFPSGAVYQNFYDKL